MKTNKQDLKSRIDELDTLSGGIVFGKEEAWDKLQSRLDRKPAVKFPFPILRAAAALVVLLLGAWAFRALLSGGEKPVNPANTVTHNVRTAPKPQSEKTDGRILREAGRRDPAGGKAVA